MSQSDFSPFSEQSVVDTYQESAAKKVPGLADLHRMTALLLSEQAPASAKILVVGAGGGMEIKAMAEAQPKWQFTGVDPSPAMLDLARQTIAAVADRVELMEGTVDQSPDGPFDGATCILTLHHIERDKRLIVLGEIRRRLKPGALFVTVEHTAPQPGAEVWVGRSVAFANRSNIDNEKTASSVKMMTEHLTLLSPSDEEALLAEAGFSNVALFYAALSFRGWVASA